ncbi:MAG: MBL fold metallo-hydrolase [Myxococcales bacterium]|nr:MBL fold metallo-hydrolase [Myxococcales bacterium]
MPKQPRASLILMLAALLAACSGRVPSDQPPGKPGEEGEDSGSDGGEADGGADGGADAFDAGTEPTSVIRPVPGEVTIIQQRLPAGVTVTLGESAIIVGPDGTMALLDVGGGSHADDLRRVVEDLNLNWLTPERGFPQRVRMQVEWLVLTHIHGDHIGSLGALLATGPDTMQVTHGIVHRGLVDLGSGMTESSYQALCNAVRGPYAAIDRPICNSATAPPCNIGSLAGSYPAIACGGLLLGDLLDSSDDGGPSYLSLGGGARLYLTGADTHVFDGTDILASASFGYGASNQENARSLAGVLMHGRFRYHFGGDMTGSGASDSPDVESHYAARAGPLYYAPYGVDVSHVHHHAYGTSSNANFVAMAAPRDGRSRNAVAGLNGGYLGSPQASVVQAWCDQNRLGQGAFWLTEKPLGGASHAALIDAQAPVTVQTIQGGLGYRVQASRQTPYSRSFRSVRP